jgi:hypothetical protein
LLFNAFGLQVWGANAATQDDAEGESEAKRSRSGAAKAVTRTPLQVEFTYTLISNTGTVFQTERFFSRFFRIWNLKLLID